MMYPPRSQLIPVRQTKRGESGGFTLSPSSSASDAGRKYLTISGTPNEGSTNYFISQQFPSSANYYYWNIQPFIPTIGGELPYEPDDWNDSESIYKYTNCYAYAIDNPIEVLNPTQYYSNYWQHPGNYAGYTVSSSISNYHTGTEYEEALIEAVKDDYEKLLQDCQINLSVEMCFFEVAFDYVVQDSRMYKVALTSYTYGEDGYHAYHWYKQNTNGFWSYKYGGGQVSQRDESNNLIANPILTDDPYSDNMRFFVLIPWSYLYSLTENQATQNLPTNVVESDHTEPAILSYGKHEKEDAA